MIPQDDTIKKIINLRINFYLYGPRASGKTYYLKNLLDQIQIPYIYLNCTFADKEVNFFKHLNHELDNFFIGRLRKIQNQQPNIFQSMLTFAISKKKILDEYQDEEDKARLIYGKKKNQMQNVQSWIEFVQNLDLQLVSWLKQIYIFMDNIQELNVSPNFLTSFYYSCQQEFSNFKIPFIFCGTGLPQKIYLLDKPFRNITSFCMRKPEKLMQSIIDQTILQYLKSHYKDQLRRQKQYIKQLENFSFKLTKQIYAAFYTIESDLNRIKKITQVIVDKVCEIVDFTADHSLEHCLNNIIMAEQGPINDFIVKRRLNQNDQQVFSNQMHMQYYPMLLLTSIHLADYADENEDARRFKDYKNMKKKIPIFDFKTRKHNVQRIVSISESLETIAKQNQKEKILKHHSLDYFGCIQHLKEQKKINSHGKAHSFVNGKLFGSVKQDEVLAFMRKNYLSYSKFTGVYQDQPK